MDKIITEDPRGYFCLLQHHIDFVTAVIPGILSYKQSAKDEIIMAIDEGILIKKGLTVTVSTRNIVAGGELGSLKRTIKEKFETLDEREKKTRAILLKLELDFMKQFKEMR